MAQRIDWTDAEIVTIPRPIIPRAQCPFCAHDHHVITKSDTSADGSVTRKVICNRCSSFFVVIVDPELDASDWRE